MGTNHGSEVCALIFIGFLWTVYTTDEISGCNHPCSVPQRVTNLDNLLFHTTRGFEPPECIVKYLHILSTWPKEPDLWRQVSGGRGGDRHAVWQRAADWIGGGQVDGRRFRDAQVHHGTRARHTWGIYYLSILLCIRAMLLPGPIWLWQITVSKDHKYILLNRSRKYSLIVSGMELMISIQ
jgi:hypothetical protein